MSNRMSGLLFNERVVAVQPTLVRATGSVSRAAVLQQVHYHAQAGHTKDYDGVAWVAITYAQLGAEIGLTADQVRRAVVKLRDLGFLSTCQPEGHVRTTWHRVDHDALSDMSKWQNCQFQVAEPPVPSGESATCSLQRTNTPPERAAPDGAAAEELFPNPEDQGQEQDPVRALVGRYVEFYSASHGGRRPDPPWIGSAGREVRKALGHGHEREVIERVLSALARENKRPAQMPVLLADFHNTTDTQPRRRP